MKHLNNILIVLAAAIMVLLTACDNNFEEQVYKGPSYVMFADTLNICPVFQEDSIYRVMLSATQPADYDRTYGVEILQDRSNAIEGYHYTVASNTVTIPAGKLSTAVEIKGIYNNIENGDSLNIRMRIVSVEPVEWDYYGLETNVRLQKVCPFSIDNYTGYAIVQSTFLQAFKQSASDQQRLITTSRVEGDSNSIILHDLMSDGFDVQVTFDNSDPLTPRASIHTGDIIGTTQEFLNATYRDNMLRVQDYPGITSTFLPCEDVAVFYHIVYVKDEGNVGLYGTVLKWISDEEAEDIIKNGF